MQFENQKNQNFQIPKNAHYVRFSGFLKIPKNAHLPPDPDFLEIPKNAHLRRFSGFSLRPILPPEAKPCNSYISEAEKIAIISMCVFRDFF